MDSSPRSWGILADFVKGAIVTERGQKKSLGESLVKDGIITAEQLKQAQEEEKRTGQHLRKVLVKMGFIGEDDLVTFLAEKLGIVRIELSNYLIQPEVVEFVPEELARKYELMPVFKIGNRLTCAMVDPWNVFALDEVRLGTNLIIEPVAATETEIKKTIDEYYGVRGTMEDMVKSIGEEEKKLAAAEGLQEIDFKKMAEEPVVIKLVNVILLNGIRDGASDIHIEPEADLLKTRFRVDGMLHEISSPPQYLQSAIISRIKIMAKLDIAERRRPQDGRFTVKMEGREIDVRVSCMPTIYGENVVMRLLDKATALLGLDQLGFSKGVFEKYQKLITRPHGIILVTGPTGSGKTTTLYGSLTKINTVEKNIITIEDPVEYKLEGIRQTQVNPKVELTFANGLRSILRQDPDIIMVGEMRDFETAEIAIQAALTGHLVFSTLHTNDAPGAITRMIDMGVEPFLASSSVIGVLAQRLVRTICPNCKEEYLPTDEELKDIGLEDRGQRTKDEGQKSKITFCCGKGCVKCKKTGYKGRIGIYELMIIDDDIRHLIIGRTATEEIRKKAIAAGMITMMDDGIEKIRTGLTTVEEVLRVTREE